MNFLATIFTTVEPVLLEIISTILAAVLVWLANTARVRFGIEIEARHREALHSAIMSGVRAALSRGLRGQDLVDAVMNHVARSTPDAIARLKPASGVLENIIEGKLREVTAGLPFVGVDWAAETSPPPPGGRS